jgi:hypothetical protein
MFFTSGLLHWVQRAASFVPDWVDLVFLGSGLTDDEDRWVRDHLGRPFHHMRSPVDDKSVWELLFATQTEHFGWLDIDCMVLEPELFREMSTVAEDHLANCAWSIPGRGGRQILRTYFLVLNADVIKSVTQNVPVSPSVYSFEPSRRGRTTPRGMTTPVSPRLERILRASLAVDPRARPPYLTQKDFYDTLQVYQLVSESLGYRVHRVRELTDLQNSEELVHLGRVSYYNWAWGGSLLPANQQTIRVIAQADYLVLSQSCDGLPARYGERLRFLREELPRLGLPTDVARLEGAMVQALVNEGVGLASARRILTAP